MNTLLREFLDKGIIVYLDDILVYTKTREEHLLLLQKLFEKLGDNKFYAKRSKCSFGQDATEFLGHEVSASGIRPLHDKLAAIQSWPKPTSVTEVQQFLGLANYYRRFVPKFAEVSAPLTELTKKTSSIDNWDGSCDKAFADLKHLLTSTPVLRLPDLSQPVYINTDASNFAISAVFQQRGEDGSLHPVLYWSRKLSPAEQNYDTREREMLSIVNIAKTFRHYLDGATFFTDHDTLKRFQTQKQLTGRLARWMSIVQDLNIEIKHIAGKDNIVADALSRRPDFKDKESSYQPVVDNEYFNGFNNDAELRAPKINPADGASNTVVNLNSISSTQVSGDMISHLQSYAWREDELLTVSNDGEVFRENNCYKVRVRGEKLFLVPPIDQLRLDIIEQAHVDAGHAGRAKTYARLREKVFWRGMAKDVQRFCKYCHVCQVNKSSNQPKPGLLHPLPVPEGKFHTVGIDFIVELPVCEGFNCLVVVIDHLTKYVWAYPCTTALTAAQCADLLYEKLFSIYGLPHTIVSDRDSRFTSSFWEQLMQRLNVKLHRSTAHHPETDGATERANQMIEQLVRCSSAAVGADWVPKLPGILLSLNTNVSRSTGYSPAQLMFGYQPRNVLDLELPTVEQSGTADEVLQKMRSDLEAAQKHLEQAKADNKRFADRNRRDVPDFTVNDLVLLSTKHLRLTGPRKFCPRWVGPFTVLKKVGALSYKLQLPEAYSRLHPVFHVSLLKPYYAADKSVAHIIPPLLEDDEETYEVQAILNHKFVGRPRRLVFQIYWKGFPLEEATWEPPESLTGCTELLQAYLNLHNLQKYVYW